MHRARFNGHVVFTRPSSMQRLQTCVSLDVSKRALGRSFNLRDGFYALRNDYPQGSPHGIDLCDRLFAAHGVTANANDLRESTRLEKFAWFHTGVEVAGAQFLALGHGSTSRPMRRRVGVTTELPALGLPLVVEALPNLAPVLSKDARGREPQHRPAGHTSGQGVAHIGR